MTSPRFLPLVAASALVFLSGCSSPTAVPPDELLSVDRESAARATTAGEAATNANGDLLVSEKGWGSFFPLEDGRVWHYVGRFEAWVTPFGGTRELWITVDYQEMWAIAGTAVLDGEEYAVVHVLRSESLGGTFESCIYLRQTRDGLFERFDPCPGAERTQRRAVATAPGSEHRPAGHRVIPGIPEDRIWLALDEMQSRVAGVRPGLARATASPRASVQADEDYPTLTRLAYPLHPGASWLVVRYEDELSEPVEFRSRVVGRERVDTPDGPVNGWRLQMLSNVFGEDTEVYFTYSKEGYLGFKHWDTSVATDETGEEIGIVESYDRMGLTPESTGGFQ